MLQFLPLVLPLVNKLLESLPSPEEKAKALKEFGESIARIDAAQLEVNKAEATSSNWFANSWRPLIGHVLALALGFQYLIVPIVLWVSTMAGRPIPIPPTLDNVLWELLFGMLGLAGLRTIEKFRGS